MSTHPPCSETPGLWQIQIWGWVFKTHSRKSHESWIEIMKYPVISPVTSFLVGGLPTPVKNDGVRRLGWWHSQLKFIIQPCSKPLTRGISHLVGGFNHLEKYEFVNGKDDIQYIMENKSHVPNHQSASYLPSEIIFFVGQSDYPHNITAWPELSFAALLLAKYHLGYRKLGISLVIWHSYWTSPSSISTYCGRSPVNGLFSTWWILDTRQKISFFCWCMDYFYQGWPSRYVRFPEGIHICRPFSKWCRS